MSGLSVDALGPSVVGLAVLLGLLGVRSYRLTRGAAYGPGKVFAFGVLALLLLIGYAGTTVGLAGEVWGGVAWVLVVPYGAVAVATAAVVVPYAHSRVRFEIEPGGKVLYRIPAFLSVTYIALFLVRLGLEVVLVGLPSLDALAMIGRLTPGSLGLLVGLDLVYCGSVGLLWGRALGVLRAYREFASTDLREKLTVPDCEPAIGLRPTVPR
jgi:hypothetical protein